MQPPTTAEILAARGPRQRLDPRRPYQLFVEPEFSRCGELKQVATVFLTNRECPFRCLMCDLWKNTTASTVPDGSIAEQIEWSLDQLEQADEIKLYNSGNFFDPRAIPPGDLARVAQLVEPFDCVVIENHPRFCDSRCVDFQRRIQGQLEVAIGLETADPQTLELLNKQMTVETYRRSVEFLTDAGIFVRTFILVQPPYQNAASAEQWACRSIDLAFDCGSDCVSLIPVRDGNGIMEQLRSAGDWQPPSTETVERSFEYGLGLHRGRVFLDLWDAERWMTCPRCAPSRRDRLQQMNHTQQIASRVDCQCELDR